MRQLLEEFTRIELIQKWLWNSHVVDESDRVRKMSLLLFLSLLWPKRRLAFICAWSGSTLPKFAVSLSEFNYYLCRRSLLMNKQILWSEEDLRSEWIPTYFVSEVFTFNSMALQHAASCPATLVSPASCVSRYTAENQQTTLQLLLACLEAPFLALQISATVPALLPRALSPLLWFLNISWAPQLCYSQRDSCLCLGKYNIVFRIPSTRQKTTRR